MKCALCCYYPAVVRGYPTRGLADLTGATIESVALAPPRVTFEYFLRNSAWFSTLLFFPHASLVAGDSILLSGVIVCAVPFATEVMTHPSWPNRFADARLPTGRVLHATVDANERVLAQSLVERDRDLHRRRGRRGGPFRGAPRWGRFQPGAWIQPDSRGLPCRRWTLSQSFQRVFSPMHGLWKRSGAAVKLLKMKRLHVAGRQRRACFERSHHRKTFLQQFTLHCCLAKLVPKIL